MFSFIRWLQIKTSLIAVDCAVASISELAQLVVLLGPPYSSSDWILTPGGLRKGQEA